MSAATADGPRRALYCLVEDENVVFKVTAPVNNHCIEDLKNLVQQEKKNGTLRNVDTSDIILSKVNTLQRSAPMLQLAPFDSCTPLFSSDPLKPFTTAYHRKAVSSHNMLLS